MKRCSITCCSVVPNTSIFRLGSSGFPKMTIRSIRNNPIDAPKADHFSALEHGRITRKCPFLQSNGGLSKVGQQQIYFLVFDIFHLYNLFRLKPQALLALYQEALAILKTKGEVVEFGKIDPSSELGNTLAKWLHTQVKQKFKHNYCSPKGLLYSFQNLLKLYASYFKVATPSN